MRMSGRSKEHRPSVSVKHGHDIIRPEEGGMPGEDEELNPCMAPHIQAILARGRRRSSCCGLAMPVPFERAAPNSFFNPKFDSDILEEQFKNSTFKPIRLRFRLALVYTCIYSLCWMSYLILMGLSDFIPSWPILCYMFITVFTFCVVMLIITFTKLYKIYTLIVSVIFTLLICLLSLSLIYFFEYDSIKDIHYIGDISQAGHFAMCVGFILIIYTSIPLPLYLCVCFSFIYSILFETINALAQNRKERLNYSGLSVRILLQLCVQLMGMHILLMTVVRMRGTFMKIGQSLLVRKQLEMEKILKEKMIHSVMPPKVADWLMSETGRESETSLKRNNSLFPRNSNTGASDLKTLFRPFNMHCMENVSILFADIVGFTKMSSNKTAEELVNILNDLFERFDELCQLNNCEKISTLGDCYYCVSGCPEPRPDHAKCCVEMGLGMINAIKLFDEQNGEGVNMRVGVHTGTILCGIVGTTRFKFDVWSNDVTLANKMESTGVPGRVHISEETSRFLTDYVLEEGDDVFGHKTYFIEGRQSQVTADHPTVINGNKLKLIISPPKCEPPHPHPLSPSVNISLVPPDEPDYSDFHACLTPPVTNPNHLSPNQFNLKAKANSLPSILDSDNNGKTSKECDSMDDEASKSPTSIGSFGYKYTNRFKNWKVPKFLRKSDPNTDNIKMDFTIKVSNSDINTADSVSSANGYQQVPIVIESIDNSNVVVHPVECNQPNMLSVDAFSQRLSNASAFEGEMLDIKSYISQSRSDVSPFARSSSYRSQYGRTSHVDVPYCRARSSTMSQLEDLPALHSHLKAICNHTEDQVSVCPSINSRKDSGIRSTSRRSSIQQQIYLVSHSALNASQDLHRRVSGYYTSSQSSLAKPYQTINSTNSAANHKNLRKQSDLQLVKCIQDNATSKCSYFDNPPISELTLFFKSSDLEKEYRDTAHRINEKEVDRPTLATSRFNTYLDVLVSALIFLIVSTSLFILYESRPLWIAVFIFFVLIQTVAIALCIHRHWELSKFIFKAYHMNDTSTRLDNVLGKLSDWYPWHFFGSIFLSLPVISVFANFSCSTSPFEVAGGDHSFYIYLFCISLLHYCNFTQINWCLKNFLVTVSVVIFVLISILYCQPSTTLTSQVSNSNFSYTPPSAASSNEAFNVSNHLLTRENSTRQHIYEGEVCLVIVLLLILICILNREFEISYRMSFYGNAVANRDNLRIQNMRNQADWLLHNIIPRHVVDQLKNTAKYSENHKDVGIIFASIVNFNELYDESYLGGKEYLRVLNELIGDFDELLEHPEFRWVDKIKTIGSTFMAASGLNKQMRQESSDPHEHLYALMDFAIAMQRVIFEFNRDLIEFNLILRIGYNFGDVTAGVIGTTKLYYDIWGDAVNIASRMDSTGVNSKVQVGEACVPVLEKVYDFEPRGGVYVKGKDNMNVYLLIRKKPEYLTQD